MTGSSAISALGEHLRSKPVIAFLALATHYVLHTFEWDTRFHLILYSWALGFGGIALITFMTGQHAGAIAATVQMTATVASLYFSVLFTSILLHRGFFHRLRKFPGPIGSRFFKAHAIYAGVFPTRFRHFEYQQQLHEKYGSDVIRTGPREVTVYCADAIPLIHGPASKCRKPLSIYGVFREATGISLQTTTDKEKHRQQRRVWDRAFNAKALRDYEPRLNRHAVTLISRLKEQSSKGPVRINKWLNFYSFDVMGDVAFSRSFGLIEKGEETDFIKLLHEGMDPLSVFAHLPWSLNLAVRAGAGAKALVEHTEWSRKVLEERIKTPPKEDDVFSWVLDKDDARVTPNMTANSHLLVVAGSDTVAATLSLLVYELCAKPHIQNKLRHEIDKVHPGQPFLDCSDVTDCEYLNGVIHEALRLHPAVPSGAARETPPEGLTLPNGTYIPGNVVICTPVYTIQRDPRYWEKPLTFMPERWTSENPNAIIDKRSFMTFLSGPYSCIGQKLAMIEMRSVVANLVRSFEITFADGEDGSAIASRSRDCFTMKVGDLDVKLTPRQS
ncbi:hypothetical protein COCC4DRAFT_203974 [Bipolaris maydis ATCC 48331]|uniref:Cytochrome P450 n=3 Tax=Cochliobolus heterostrophus TaxID=5016 RepID=M2UVE6_COCH5|nr:uncharacterized protein COCC4DRAFT_203974 [Bipolaris maydis ATCC 48331]EMD97546.1 hypothetical protein COCHEDRAFT_1200225 [Bipolaris maydis C5]KAH7557919.1 hypothetical protein BM1_05191 [Bipolaris maydis]ENI01316.1 hypothetical protein COCC4DRAFT_203974 [Bipolaris maydis ATCC 48331]KAJ5046986.1 cytochrome P450 [Bipolaris maydis]KAJ5052693.1 cytochrome P450 [Bipolaris maydis]